ncbi:discoidin domain-containing receptor 2-like [Pollicipes pollicipes]|uniref:discoidin domain-containing receptor 2-like n=1 Tax=Pollicipes pollicipes TaxID=41117 RepID=UPI0018854BBA|nr:discoidin domain-containing receptor 2-like [Pollicipes pollicipes]
MRRGAPCHIEGGSDVVPDVIGPGCRSLVAVKTLRPGTSQAARADFEREARTLARLQDPNIVRVLGLCTREEPLCVVVEYMEHGDLNQYLQQHVAETALHASGKVLSYGSLIYMATQISSGMKYLESLNFVHRDLATRNCLVGRGHMVKISDFGMSRGVYANDYYKIEGRTLLPIRWMAWEAIFLGKFTTKSDVWSFAVTLWEVLTYARQQPYEEMTDERVIETLAQLYHNDAQQVYLPQPHDCPREIYDLLLECWRRDPLDPAQPSVFSLARVTGSVGGRHFNTDPVTHYTLGGGGFNGARNVSVKMPRVLARYLRLELQFAAAWILVSEVTFESEPAVGNFSDETGPLLRETALEGGGRAGDGQRIAGALNGSRRQLEL